MMVYGRMEVEFHAFFRSTVDGVKSSASQFGRSRLGERDDIIHSTGGRMSLSICRAEKSVPELITSLKCETKQAVVQGHNIERMARDRTSGYRMGYEILSCAEWLRFVWGFVAVLVNQIDPNIVALRTPQNSCTEQWIHLHSSGTIYLTILESDQTGHQFVQAPLQNYSMSAMSVIYDLWCPHFSQKPTVRPHVIFWLVQQLRSGFKILYDSVGQLMVI